MRSKISSVFCEYCFLKVIYLWLCWVFAAALGLSLAAVSRGYSLLEKHELWSMQASGVVAHRLGCPTTTCVIFPDEGSNLCPLHWQVGEY